jgi:hypothetical protein
MEETQVKLDEHLLELGKDRAAKDLRSRRGIRQGSSDNRSGRSSSRWLAMGHQGRWNPHRMQHLGITLTSMKLKDILLIT